MMRTVLRVRAVGGPEAMQVEEEPVPLPGPGEVQLEQRAIGLNFIDVYLRSGLYPSPLPMIPGQEGVGVVTALGPHVTGLTVGSRVGYAGVLGAYASRRIVPAERLIPLPDRLDDLTAGSVLLKGMTAEYLVRRCHRVKPGDVVVIHAAAGGVGQLAVQWARHLGATVIGVVGTASKAHLVSTCGAHHVVTLESQNLVEVVKSLTNGHGADVVYDSVGKATLAQSLDSLRPRGLLVSFGQSSGMPDPIALSSLGGARSLYVTRPSMHAYVHSRAELEESSGALMEVLLSGVVKVRTPTTFPLVKAAEAHRALEGRRTTGSVVLLPG